jgi:SAM-dependent methyltransferase
MNIVRIIKEMTIIEKVFYILLVIVLLNIISKIGTNNTTEGFEQNSHDFITKEGTQVYDDFYVQIYDDLVFSKVKNDFEIGQIIKQTAPTNQSIILDIGSGIGHHVSSLNSHGLNAIGIDVSESMVKKAKETYPDLHFRLGNVLDSMIFQEESFTHITCLYFTIYYIKNKHLFFENCMHWLMPGGFLAIHLVDRNNFDPILPAGDPFGIISPQKYAKKRITSTNVKFDDFSYKSNFEVYPNDDTAVLHEVFNFKDINKSNRKNKHQFYMPTQRQILNIAKNTGFILSSEISMLKCNYGNQFIYILQKPN